MSASPPHCALSVFVSYCHRDHKDKDKLETHLKAIETVELWSDTAIAAGLDWRPAIETALDAAAVVVLLVTPDFLASEFVTNTEIPKVLDRRRAEGLAVFPIIARPCAWKLKPWLESMQVRPKDAKPVWRSGGRYADDELTQITYEIATAVRGAHIVSGLSDVLEKVRAEQALAAERQRVDDEIQQVRATMESENHKQQMVRWKILQETQDKIFGIQRDITSIKSDVRDKPYKKWEEYIRA